MNWVFGLISAGALAVGLWQGANWLRKDAQADLLRDLQLRQIERTTQDMAARELRKKEIENASPDELRRRACIGGMLPASACPTTGTSP